MAKINERILNKDDLEKERLEEEKEFKDSTKTVPEMQEYGEIRVPKSWKNPPKLADLKHDIEYAIIEHNEIIQEINHHLDMYHTTPNGVGRPRKQKGRSNAQPMSIRKAAEWRYATLSEPFLDSPKMFKGEPATGLDVNGTKQAETVLNFQMKNQVGLVDFIDNYIKDLVDTGTAIIRTNWVEKEISKEIDRDVVRYVDAPELEQDYVDLLQLMREDPELFNRNHEPELVKTLEISIEEGRPLKREVVRTEKATVIETIKNQPELVICDYRDVIPDPTCRGKQENLQFVGYKIRTTKADLMKDPRYSNVDDIIVSISRELSRETGVEGNEGMDQDSQTFQFKDPNRQPIEGIEYWGYVATDDSGILTPVVFTWFGDVLVRAEENPYPDKKIPFTFVPYLKRRNSLYGEPDGLLIQEDQKIAGAITRGVVDMLAKQANGQRGIPKGALDYSNLQLFRAGKDFEFNPTQAIGRDGIAQITKFPEIPQSALQIKLMAENDIKEMTGTQPNQASTNHGGNLGTQNSDALTKQGMSKAARRELGILRRIADGLIEVGHKICAMNVEFLDDEEIIRITDDEFVVINREELDCRYDLSLSISTAEDDAVKAQEIAFFAQTSTDMDPEFRRMLLADMAELRRMPEKAEMYRNYQQKPNPLEERKQQLEIAKLEAEIAEINNRAAENQAEADRERANAEKMRAEARLANAKADAVNLKYLEDETGLSHEREIEKQGAQAQGNIELEKAKHDLEKGLEPEGEKPVDNLQENLTFSNNAGTNTPEPLEDDQKSFDQLLAELDNIGTQDDLNVQ